MSNNFPTMVVIADKMLEFFENTITIGTMINRDYETNFQASKDSIGQTIQVKKPPRYTAQDGPVIESVQSINTGLIPVTINRWKTVPIKLTGFEKTFSAKQFDSWAQDNLAPMLSPIVNAIDADVYGLYNQIYNFVGTPGTGPTSFDAIGAAKEKLSFMATPQEDRLLFINPTGTRKLGTSLTTLYNPSGPLGTNFTQGKIPPIAGFDPYEAQNVAVHTVGTATGTPLCNGANQQGPNLVTDGWTTASLNLKKGDVFQISSVNPIYSVNPTTKLSTGLLQDFVCLADSTSDSSGNLTIPISPPIITSGAFQTVSAAVADNAVITVKTGTAATAYAQHLGFWKKALGLITVPIAPLKGLNSTTRSYKGMSITLSQGADIMKYEEIYRADVAYGVVAYYPENCCRITG
jgi:hypothetical protein